MVLFLCGQTLTILAGFDAFLFDSQHHCQAGKPARGGIFDVNL
jgi:hypothetical protein